MTRHYYKVDSRLVVEVDGSIMQWNSEREKWQTGPKISILYEQADNISQQELAQYSKAIECLDDLYSPENLFIEKVIGDSERMLSTTKMAELIFSDDIRFYTNQEQSVINKALTIAKEVHQNQTRDEGSPYILHCIAVARKAIEFGGNVDDVIVCLLHDTYEDFVGNRSAFFEEIKQEFGEETANSIVKLSKWRSDSKIDDCVYLSELSADLTNLKRKGYDRICNLQSLRFTNETKREKYLEETEKKYISLFEKFYPELSVQMKTIIELYRNNQLPLTEWEKEKIKTFSKK